MPACGLTVMFVGTAHAVTDGFGFGRDAALVLDEANRYLHGEAGRFNRGPGGWSLHNTGTRLHLKVVHGTGQIVELPPGAATMLAPGRGTIRIKAGPSAYELAYDLEGGPPAPEPGQGGSDTLPYGRALTPAQLDYVLALAEPRLRGWTLKLPTSAEIARRWGVSERTVSHAFEEVRVRLREAGVRRITAPEQLVEYLVVNRIVTLELLEAAGFDDPDGPRRRADIERGRARCGPSRPNESERAVRSE